MLIELANNCQTEFAPGDVKVSFKSIDVKPFYARWIVETYNHLKHQNDTIIKGFDAAGVSKAITCENDVFTRVENLFDEQREQQNFYQFFRFFS